MPSSQENVVKIPRAFAPLERQVELSRELVANLKEARVLIEGVHDEEIKRHNAIEGKKFDSNVIAPVKTFVMDELSKAKESLVPGSGVVVVPSEMKEKAKILQSLAGTLMANAIKLDNHARGITVNKKPAGKPDKPHKKRTGKNMGTDPEVMAAAVKDLESMTAKDVAKKYKMSVPTLYVWRSKLNAAAEAAKPKVKPRAYRVAVATKGS